MLKNNFKIAWRALQKNSTYTFISIAGLAIGIAATLLIFQIVQFESGFNKGFDRYNRIGRIVSNTVNEDGEGHSVCMPIPAMDVVEQNIPELEKVARVKEIWSNLTVPDPNGGAPIKKFALEENTTAFFTETNFFEIFNFKWIEGDPKTALEAPNSIVLTRSWADKCFDKSGEALGQTILIDNLIPAKVTGIIEDLPLNCDFNFPFLISYPTLKNNQEMFFYSDSWGSCSSNNQLYALLTDENEISKVNSLLSTVGEEEYKNASGIQAKTHLFQPLSLLHYDENFQNSGSHRISKSRLKILSGIGILILLMACFNFINLTTAQSTLRSKEVGVRKTLGSSRIELTTQFLTETFLIVIFSMFLGVILAFLARPLLEKISEVPGNLPFLSQPSLIGFIIITTVVVTLISGLYPALALSSFKPIEAIRSNLKKGNKGGSMVRRILVVLQFTIAQALIIAALINILQLDYVRSKDLGFAQDLVYTFSMNNDSLTLSKQSVLKNKLLAIPEVKTVSLSSDQPLSGNTWSSNFRYSSRPEDERFAINIKFADKDYLDTYGLHLTTGRWLNESDTMREVVLNETTLQRLNVENPEAAINQTLRLNGRDLKIVGIVKDFHQHSLRSNFQPLAFSTRKEFYWETGLKIRPDNIGVTVSKINQVYDEVLPEQIFAGQFLDESIAEFYQNDERLSSTTKFFGFLAIIISCLGLFGLASHAAAQRIKEIGVRKVLGATIGQIVILLAKDFLKLVGIALLLASPVAAYFMRNWLDNFVFRIPMPWWVFGLAGVLALTIALFTVGYQGIRAARVNPIESLRDE